MVGASAATGPHLRRVGRCPRRELDVRSDVTVRALFVLLVLSFSFTGSAAAQDVFSVEGLRSHARAWGWHVTEARQGSLTRETWCPGEDPSEEQDAERIALVFDGGSLVSFSARRVAFADGWDADVSVQPSLSGAFGFSFSRGAEQLTLGQDVSFEHGGLGLGVPFTEAEAERGYAAIVLDALRAFIRSAASLRRRALGQTAALRAFVRAQVSTYSICGDPGAPGRFEERESVVQGGTATGIFDTCVHRPMTAGEQRELLHALDDDIQRRDAIVRAHHRTFFVALRALLGLEPA